MATRFLDIFGMEHYHNLIKTEVVTATQAEATNAWTGDVDAAGLPVGKHILYKLTEGSASGPATLNLTFPNGTTSGAIPVKRVSGNTVNSAYPAGTELFMIYDGTDWKVLREQGQTFKKRMAITSAGDFDNIIFDPTGYTYEGGDESLIDVYLNGLRLDSTEYTAAYTSSNLKITITNTFDPGDGDNVIEMDLRK